jgi:DNA processing protein
MDKNLLINWLRLAFTPRVGSKTFLKLLSKFHNTQRVLENLDEIKNLYKLDLKPPNISQIEDQLAALDKFGGEVLIPENLRYPKLLREINDYPMVLFTKGNLELLNKPIVAIVGTRNSSFAGEKITKTIAEDLGKAGLVVVSGLARGIDSAAHQGALATGTIGVIASGLDTFYPKENQSLQEKLFDNGLVISENPLGSVPLAQNFPRRNRIISGLSLGLLVAEGKKNSGTMITANYALEQGREVFALPGSPLEPRSEGTNWLIKNGAILTRDAQDILFELNLSPLQEIVQEKKEQRLEKLNNLDPTSLLLSKIGQVPVDLDELFIELNLTSAIFQEIIIELELSGKIQRKGNKISLI